MRPFQEEIVSQTKAGCEGLNAFEVICELLNLSLRNKLLSTAERFFYEL